MGLIDEHDRTLIRLAIAEDLGDRDITTALLSNRRQPAEFRLIVKQPGVFVGSEAAEAVAKAYDETIEITWDGGCADGTELDRVPVQLAVVVGPLDSVLAAERVLLNFVQRLSGVATLTRRFVNAVEGTGAIICDTRKTTPGWRKLEKYAVQCAGGRNHRFGLFDAILIKDNHLAGIDPQRIASGVFDMLNRLDAAGKKPDFVAVEAQSIHQLDGLFKVVGIDVVVLDNFTLDALKEAVTLRDDHGLRGKVALEASGGVRLENVRTIAETGVDRISVGALTHSAAALDMSLERV